MIANYIQVYEQAFLGIGMSMWVIIVLAIIIMFGIVFGLVVFSKLGPTQGYLYAAFGKNDDKNVGIIFQNHSVTIKKLRYFSGVFDALGMSWEAKKIENHRFGECNVEVLTDFWGLTMDPKINAAALEFIKAWNSDLEFELFPESDYAWLPPKAKRATIEDFDSLYAAIEQCPPDCDIRTRAFTYVPIYELQRYFPKNLSASNLTGYIEALKKVMGDKAQSAATSILPIICLAVGVLLGAGVAFLVR